MYKILGDYPKALEYLGKSLRIQKEIGDREGQVCSLDNIGRVYFEKENYNKARRYLNEAKKIVRRTGAKEILRTIYLSLGEFEIIQNNTKKAEDYARKALKLAIQSNSKLCKAEGLLLQAKIYAKEQLPMVIRYDRGKAARRGKYETREKVEEKFKMAIEIFEELKQVFEIAKAYFYYGQFLLEKIRFIDDEKENIGLRADATKYLKKAKEIFEKIGVRVWVRKIEEFLKGM